MHAFKSPKGGELERVIPRASVLVKHELPRLYNLAHCDLIYYFRRLAKFGAFMLPLGNRESLEKQGMNCYNKLLLVCSHLASGEKGDKMRRNTDSRFSDHRPVCAIFAVEVDVKSLNKVRFRKGYSCAASRLVDDSTPQKHSFNSDYYSSF
ncbi:hypothetical protein YC2023_109153 [Brassica napus]